MPLSWNEIRDRAIAFSKDWRYETSEGAESKSFWDGFFTVFGRPRRRFASYEVPVQKLDGHTGYIDLLWKGKLLIEHKSRGKSLDSAYQQSRTYLNGLPDHELPRYVLVSDFARFRLYDLKENTEHEFVIEDLPKNIHRFSFIAGYETRKINEQDPVNIEAAQLMGKLHDEMLDSGYSGHDLEVYLVRLLFCLFAEDTGIFEAGAFYRYIKERTHEDGSDLGSQLHQLFSTLNTAESERQNTLDEQLNKFVYINGKLFTERLQSAHFNSKMRDALLNCCLLDWSVISPAIFGSLFQSIMDKQARRDFGAHYTSEANILKLINPLFMDDLRAEFEKVKRSKNRLLQFHKKLHALRFLDPACGCGNFLVIAYRELRKLELEVLRTAYKGIKTFDVHSIIALNVDQFYGIEIEEFPAQIAQVAMWLVDHQMNLLVEEEFGKYYARIPLVTSANIVHGNALRLDWREVVPPSELNYIMGNPPFIGQRYRPADKTAEMQACFRHAKNVGKLDYVTAWYCKAAAYIADSDIKAAFVSTNSITQGSQVAPLWSELRNGVKTQIHFAHQTFKWKNEAGGVAGVYCVIIGFGAKEAKVKRLFEYESVTAEPKEIKASNINPYLLDAPDVFIGNRAEPLGDVSPIVGGNTSNDGGYLLLDEAEQRYLVTMEPHAKNWIRPFLTAKEFLYKKPRYCLWLVGCKPGELREMKLVRKRVEAVRKLRKSKNLAQRFVDTPSLFVAINQPTKKYIFIPQVSSEKRTYIPIAFCTPRVVCGAPNFQIPSASMYEFGVLTSLMHNAWMRVVCGRLESRYRYSANIVYNNFPWPQNPTEKQIATIKIKAQDVLDARKEYKGETLADLYDPITMPPPLQKAHAALDKSVDRAYRRHPFKTETERVAFLFDLYRQYTAPTFDPTKKRRRKKTS